MATLENELSRALSRLSGAIARLESAVATRQDQSDEADTRELTALRQDAQALREVHHAVTGKLEHAIKRLRLLVGDGGVGEERLG